MNARTKARMHTDHHHLSTKRTRVPRLAALSPTAVPRAPPAPPKPKCQNAKTHLTIPQTITLKRELRGRKHSTAQPGGGVTQTRVRRHTHLDHHLVQAQEAERRLQKAEAGGDVEHGVQDPDRLVQHAPRVRHVVRDWEGATVEVGLFFF